MTITETYKSSRVARQVCWQNPAGREFQPLKFKNWVFQLAIFILSDRV